MSEAPVLPVAHEVAGHEVVEGEGHVFVSEGGHQLPGVGAAVGSVHADPGRGGGRPLEEKEAGARPEQSAAQHCHCTAAALGAIVWAGAGSNQNVEGDVVAFDGH